MFGLLKCAVEFPPSCRVLDTAISLASGFRGSTPHRAGFQHLIQAQPVLAMKHHCNSLTMTLIDLFGRPRSHILPADHQ